MGREKSYKRKSREIPEKDTILILCQGKETEKNYFNSLGEDESLITEAFNVEVKSKNPLRMIDYALKKNCLKKSKYIMAWCVFDMDETKSDEFNKAVFQDGKQNIRVAYSNPMFELWFLLHYRNLDVKLHRKAIGEKIGEIFWKIHNKEYKKNDEGIYQLLKEKMEQAIQNAEILYSKCDRRNPARANPSTTIHLLINELKNIERKAPTY